MISNIGLFLKNLVSPTGSVSAAAIIGFVYCIIGLLGHFTFMHITDANSMTWQGLAAIGVASGETITNIAGNTFGKNK